MDSNKLSIFTLLVIILTSYPALADKGGGGNGGGSWGGGGSWQEPVENIPGNVLAPGHGLQQYVQPSENIPRQELQPKTEQIKRDYNQLQREQKQQFQQNWKTIKKIK